MGSSSEGLGACLPIDCDLTDDQLTVRIADGVMPQDGNEYLARVRLQASRFPVVMKPNQERLNEIKRIDQNIVKKPVHVPKPPKAALEGTVPSMDWKEKVVQEFVDCRQYIARWEDRAADGWSGVLSEEIPPKKNDVDAWSHLREAMDPKVGFLIQIEQVVSAKVLKDFIYLIGDGLDQEPFTRSKCVWYYALLARVEKPLSVGLESHLRTFLRFLYEHRNDKSTSMKSVDTLIALLEQYYLIKVT